MSDVPTEIPIHAPSGALLLAASAMGTRFELIVPDDGSSEAHRRSAGETALAEVVELDARLSLFRKDSLLSHINRVAPREWVRLDEDTFVLVALCAEIWRESDGLFDVTIAPIMREWGLHRDSVLPTDPGLRTDSGAIEFDEPARSVRFRTPVALDLGGVAKGFALDIAIRTLRDAGIEHAFIQGGTSSIAAIGTSTPVDVTPTPWRVGIAVPEGAAPNGTVMLEVRNMALSVSAHHGRTVEGRGHIIDPTRHAPARDDQRSADLVVAAAVAAVIADVSPGSLAWPCACTDGWTKPVLLAGARPQRLPPSMTALIGTGSIVTIAGPHRVRSG